MLNMSGISKAGLLGERAQIAVERALSEFRSGRPVLITSASDAITALPVDGMMLHTQIRKIGHCCSNATQSREECLRSAA